MSKELTINRLANGFTLDYKYNDKFAYIDARYLLRAVALWICENVQVDADRLLAEAQTAKEDHD